MTNRPSLVKCEICFSGNTFVMQFGKFWPGCSGRIVLRDDFYYRPSATMRFAKSAVDAWQQIPMSIGVMMWSMVLSVVTSASKAMNWQCVNIGCLQGHSMTVIFLVISWWRHYITTLSTSLTICDRIPLYTVVEFLCLCYCYFERTVEHQSDIRLVGDLSYCSALCKNWKVVEELKWMVYIFTYICV